MFQNRLLPGLAALPLLAGCAVSGPAFTDAPAADGKALVYIYRPNNQWISGQDAGFEANGKRIGFLDPGGYSFFHAPPGHYEIRQFWPIGWETIQMPALWTSMRMTADFRAGEIRYIRLKVYEVAEVRCTGPTTAVTAPDGSQSRTFSSETSYYDPSTYTSYPLRSWCIGLSLAEVPAAIAQNEIRAQKFQPQNKAMPAEFKP